MTRMTGPDCVVMCNLINTYIHTYIYVRRLALRVYYLHRGVVSGIRFRISKIWSRLPPSRGRARDISCACEQQEGTIPSMFAVCNVD